MKTPKLLHHADLGKRIGVLGLLAAMIASPVIETRGSSHMDAPLITNDDAANTTDLYAFKSMKEGVPYLTVALAVYPFEVPGVGPNKYNFDDNVLYSIHLATGNDIARGEDSVRYNFRFNTAFQNDATILQSYTGVVEDVGDANQNLVQTYTVTKVRGRRFPNKNPMKLGTGMVPPNNQGIATPYYNLSNDGNLAAKPGVDDEMAIDKYTAQGIYELSDGYRVFAGQREDGFYGDIQSIFDLLQLRSGGPTNSFDSQSGFNVHTIVLEIPLSEIGGESQVVGVYSTTSRPRVTINRALATNQAAAQPRVSPLFSQVGRQGNPLFCEALIGLADKDLYNRSQPRFDDRLFSKYALAPELAAAVGSAYPDNRTDLVGIFIPDMIKVDLSTEPARLTGGGNDDMDFSRLGIFGGDVLISTVQDGFTALGQGVIPGGWPNGRRFGDDVIDIAVTALLSDLRDPDAPVINSADGVDNVSANDSIYHKVFPYAGTPHNGRNYRANPNLVNP